MKRKILFLIYGIFCFNILFPQINVVNISANEKLNQFVFIPDVDGKVLIEGDLKNILVLGSAFDPIELYPNWPLQLTGDSQRGGIYCNLDEDDDLEIVYNVSQNVYAWNLDGSIVNGWPVTVQLFPDGAPAFGDIDGDGEGEIVVSTRQSGTGNTGRLHAFNPDGSPLDGFPVILGGGTTKTPVLADLNGDEILEIILEERNYPNGYVSVYLGDGNVFPGFPVLLDYIPASSVAVGDVTGDTIPEIIAESYYSVYAFDINGNVLEGFPYTPGNSRVFSYSSPVLADLDNDGKREIIVGDHSLSSGNGAVHVLRYDGSIFPGWPKYTGYWIYGPPAVADIDGDGSLDIAIGDQVLSGSPVSKVFVWDKDGNYLPGWPISSIWAVNNQIIIADLDGDNLVELMWDDNTNAGIYLGYNHDGTPMQNWPLNVTGSTFFMNPFVADINNDGVLDISGASADLDNYDIYFYLWNTNVAVNEPLAMLPILQYNVRHDGVFMDPNTLNADFVGNPLMVCETESVHFTDQSTTDVISWDWAFEGGNPATSAEQNPEVYYDLAGQFDVSLTVSDGTNSQSITKSDYIHVYADPVVPDQPVGPIEVITSQTPYTIYETIAPNATGFSWQLIPENMGTIVAGDTVNQVKVSWIQSNSYVAQLSVKAENPCGVSELSEPLAIYVNWNTDISVQEKDIFKVFPNPSIGILYIDVKKISGDVVLSILNTIANIVKKEKFTLYDSNIIKVDLDELNNGVYFLKLETNETTITRKLLLIR